MKDIPAFPGKQKALMIKSEHIDIANEYEIEHNGMTLRDYFAAKAMQGLLANGWCAEQREIAPNMGEREIALDAYRLADAMMKAREA